MVDGPVWMITGASRGLGNEFAKVALERGCRVAATARRPEAVHDSLGRRDGLLAVALDVTDAGQIDAAVRSVLETFGRIDVLVNNAGYGIFGALEETTDAEARAIFDTNVFGMMNVTRAVLPSMRGRGRGRIVNIGSMASFACDPGGALYDATKFAVAAVSEALALEMKGFGVESMVVEPGMFRTNFFDSSAIRALEKPLAAYDGTPARGALEYCLDHNYRQQGDPRKAAQLVYDVVSSDEPLPLWLPVGKDAVKKFEKKLGAMIESIRPYRERCCDCLVDEGPGR